MQTHQMINKIGLQVISYMVFILSCLLYKQKKGNLIYVLKEGCTKKSFLTPVFCIMNLAKIKDLRKKKLQIK